MTHKKIEGKEIYLRELIPNDASEEYSSWLNDISVNKYLETRKSNIEDVRKFISKQISDPNSVFVGIFDKATDKHIGNIKLEPVDWKQKSGVFGIVIGNREYLGMGIGTQATKLFIQYSFIELGLERIELGVISKNIRARKAFKKSGFKEIKTLKKALDHGGILYDKIVMVVNKNKEEINNK